MRPAQIPVGLRLTQVTRAVSRAFDEVLAEAGGSLPAWLVLLNLKAGRARNQRELAAAVGIRDATLTHHLNSMESGGLVSRRRDPGNRRIHIVELTPAGEQLFSRLRTAAVAFDTRLRSGLTGQQLKDFAAVLDQLAVNVGGLPGEPPWAGAAGQ